MTAPAPLLTERTDFLAPYVHAGVLLHADVQVAGAIAQTVPGVDDDVLLAAALTVRATRLSHVCLDLADVPAGIATDEPGDLDTADDGTSRPSIGELRWPEGSAWVAALAGSPAVADVSGTDEPSARAGVVGGDIRPLVLDGSRLYLERYWRYERQVGDQLIARTSDDGTGDAGMVSAAAPILDHLFGGPSPDGPDLQRRAAEAALSRRLVVLAGGPGTGKTRTVARLLAALHQVALDDGRPAQIALAAPTGKAAARMTEAVRQAVLDAELAPDLAEPLLTNEASTIHRLLGPGDGVGFRHDHRNPLPADVVVIDEASMVALPLMARLLDAVRPGARVVLVGDPYQLASIEAGAVLGDIVGGALTGADGPLRDSVTILQRMHRFGADSTIAALAAAIRDGDADTAIELLAAGNPDMAWVRPDDQAAVRALRHTVTDNAVEVVTAALDGDAPTGLAHTSQLKVLAATRWGPFGTYDWRDRIERAVAAREPRIDLRRRWYVGRPVIVTRNDRLNQLVNGDTGLVVAHGEGAAVAFPHGEHPRLLQPSQLASIETWWSMTIHKSQGSEYDHAVVSLPTAAGSPILTRELLYTAITRGRDAVTVVGGEEALRAAIARPVRRASGLGDRLWSA